MPTQPHQPPGYSFQHAAAPMTPPTFTPRPQFVAKKKTVHMWQIFTALAIVLTIASSLIYFQSIVPRSKNADFIAITKTKTTFYNQMEYIKTYYGENYNQNLVGVQLTAACYSDVANVSAESETLQASLDEMNEQQRYVDALREDFQKRKLSSQYARLLTSYADSVQKYLTDVTLTFEKQELYKSKTLAIQKQAAVVCGADLATVEKELEIFDTLLEEFPLSSLQTLTDWHTDAKSWSDLTKDMVKTIKRDDYQPEQIQEKLTEFRRLYVNIFSVAFDYEAYAAQLEEVYEKSVVALEQVEQFEVDYIAKNNVVEGNTILVTKKQAEASSGT